VSAGRFATDGDVGSDQWLNWQGRQGSNLRHPVLELSKYRFCLFCSLSKNADLSLVALSSSVVFYRGVFSSFVLFQTEL
jgi:hypothetical protein